MTYRNENLELSNVRQVELDSPRELTPDEIAAVSGGVTTLSIRFSPPSNR